MALGIFLLYFFRYLAVQFCGRVTPEGEPVISFRLGVFVLLKDRYGGLQIEPCPVCFCNTVSAKSGPAFVDVLIIKEILTCLDIVQIVVGCQVPEKGD